MEAIINKTNSACYKSTNDFRIFEKCTKGRRVNDKYYGEF